MELKLSLRLITTFVKLEIILKIDLIHFIGSSSSCQFDIVQSHSFCLGQFKHLCLGQL